MRIIKLLFFIFCIQTSFAQIKSNERFYQLYESFQKLEDSIATKVNPVNTLIYETCDGYRAFYFFRKRNKFNYGELELIYNSNISFGDKNYSLLFGSSCEFTAIKGFETSGYLTNSVTADGKASLFSFL